MLKLSRKHHHPRLLHPTTFHPRRPPAPAPSLFTVTLNALVAQTVAILLPHILRVDPGYAWRDRWCLLARHFAASAPRDKSAEALPHAHWHRCTWRRYLLRRCFRFRAGAHRWDGSVGRRVRAAQSWRALTTKDSLVWQVPGWWLDPLSRGAHPLAHTRPSDTHPIRPHPLARMRPNCPFAAHQRPRRTDHARARAESSSRLASDTRKAKAKKARSKLNDDIGDV